MSHGFVAVRASCQATPDTAFEDQMAGDVTPLPTNPYACVQPEWIARVGRELMDLALNAATRSAACFLPVVLTAAMDGNSRGRGLALSFSHR